MEFVLWDIFSLGMMFWPKLENNTWNKGKQKTVPFAITLEQKIRSSRPTLDSKVSSFANILHKANFFCEYVEIQSIHKCVPILFFIPQQIQNYPATKTNKTENIFSPWKWLTAWTSQIFRFSRDSLCLESMRAAAMHSWTHFFYKFVQDNSNLCLWKCSMYVIRQLSEPKSSPNA